MKHKDAQLLKKILSECKDISRSAQARLLQLAWQIEQSSGSATDHCMH